MRFGNVEVRPVGGGVGCLMMLLVSVIASVVLTILLNVLFRSRPAPPVPGGRLETDTCWPPGLLHPCGSGSCRWLIGIGR